MTSDSILYDSEMCTSDDDKTFKVIFRSLEKSCDCVSPIFCCCTFFFRSSFGSFRWLGQSGSRCEVFLHVRIPTVYESEKVWLHPSARGNLAELGGGVRIVGCHGKWSCNNLINHRMPEKKNQKKKIPLNSFVIKFVLSKWWSFWSLISFCDAVMNKFSKKNLMIVIYSGAYVIFLNCIEKTIYFINEYIPNYKEQMVQYM